MASSRAARRMALLDLAPAPAVPVSDGAVVAVAATPSPRLVVARRTAAVYRVPSTAAASSRCSKADRAAAVDRVATTAAPAVVVAAAVGVEARVAAFNCAPPT